MVQGQRDYISRREQIKQPVLGAAEASICWELRPQNRTEYSSPNEKRNAKATKRGCNTSDDGSEASGRKQPSPSERYLCGSTTFRTELRLLEARFEGGRMLNDTARTTIEHATTAIKSESTQGSITESDVAQEIRESPQKVNNGNESSLHDSREVLALIPSTTRSSVGRASHSGSENSIDSTKKLVEALNKCKSPEELKCLIHWARQYMQHFCSVSVVGWSKEELGEYGAFVDVKPNSHPSKMTFLLDWFNTMAHRVANIRFGQEHLLEVLESTLYRIDHDVFRGNPDPLIGLIKYLIGTRLCNENTGLTRGTHETHKVILHCARYAMNIAGEVEPNSWDPVRDDSLYRTLQNQLEELKQRVTFYPTGFEIQLVAESLKQLRVPGFRTDWQSLLRRTRTGITAMTYAIDIVRNAITLSFDPANLRACADYISEAVSPVSQKVEAWFVRYQTLNAAYFRVLEDPSNYKKFRKVLQTCKQKKRRWIDISGSVSKGEKAIAYGIVELLTQLAVYSVDAQVRDSSVTELYRMQKEWLRDEDILYHIWQSFGIVAAQGRGEISKKALLWLEQYNSLHVSDEALDVIGSQSVSKTAECCRHLLLKSSFVKWIGTRGLQTKLESFKKTMNVEIESVNFFNGVKKPSRLSVENLALSV